MHVLSMFIVFTNIKDFNQKCDADSTIIKLTRSIAFVVGATTLQLNLEKRKTATAVF